MLHLHLTESSFLWITFVSALEGLNPGVFCARLAPE